MRFVDRRLEPPPHSLLSEEARRARALIEAHLLREEVERRQRRTPYDPELLWEDGVQKAVLQLFAHKCAFCETSLAVAPSSVEQFRPREGASGQGGYSEAHYAWLCYDWENLYAACVECNRSRQDQFPVEGRRASLFTTVNEARAQEAALLLDPCYDDPRQHLTFRLNGAIEGNSPKGESTIAVFRLDRAILAKRRSEHAAELIERLYAAGPELDSVLHSALQPEARHLGMTTQLLARFFHRITGASPRWPREGVRPDKAIEHFRRFDAEQIQQGLRDFEAADNAAVKVPDPVLVGRSYSADSYAVGAVAHEPFRSGWIARERPRCIILNSFKGVEALKLDIPEITPSGNAGCLMLLGENATGKSSVLEAVALTLLGEDQASQLVSAETLLRRKGDRQRLIETDLLEVRIEFYGDSPPAELRVDPLARRYEGNRPSQSVVLGYGPRRYAIDGQARRHRRRSARVEGLFRPAFAMPDPKPWLTKLAAEEGARYYAVARGLREVLALNESDNLVVDDDLGICVDVHGERTPLTRLSEGYKSLFVLAVDIMRELLEHFPDLEKAEGVVLVDEIETHLHPRWKLRIMSALRKAMPNVTFIATTHDPLCLRGMEDGEVVVLHRGRDQKVRRIEDLPSVKGMRAEQLLTSDYFGLNSTADPEMEAKLLSYVARLGEQTSSGAAAEAVEQLGEDLSRTLVLGETPADQLVQEAIGRYLADRRARPAPERTAAREAVVAHVLQALRAPLES